MNFVDRITFHDLVGSIGVEGRITPVEKQVFLDIEKKINLTSIDHIVELRDKLSIVIKKFAEVTGTVFE